MKNLKSILFVLFFLISSLVMMADSKDIVVKPMLPCGFAKICIINGTIVKEDIYKYKGRENDIIFSVESVAGMTLKQPIVIIVVPFDMDIAKLLLSASLYGDLELVGYESFSVEGIPPGLDEYVSIPATKTWSLSQFFVVVQVKPLRKSNQDSNLKNPSTGQP